MPPFIILNIKIISFWITALTFKVEDVDVFL